MVAVPSWYEWVPKCHGREYDAYDDPLMCRCAACPYKESCYKESNDRRYKYEG